ncbi:MULTISPECIES: PD-(D/E)XK nuclease-like domain-containing protein [unclassified Polaromonas]|uniref:PD-(D/E)XK nuclease-like domain-containing protein n=1 Tax=unclassified Polaromonas TaxID=2638319 RepID=UPI0008AE1AFB|nr:MULTISPECIES: PD-(D/E)XK nuclease-like domain-containing protein [unclassified Polaromonas]MDP2449114.1 PD-(D/E)XK nuclease-like domain-containing protein [Polaromonas sp.]OGB25081.1 MAG: hypothetical protein A3I66_21505 [Burkholderiales bacterium RIFCSPLOWO2_02_FULL_57_36]
MNKVFDLTSSAALFGTTDELSLNVTAGATPFSRMYADMTSHAYHADREVLSCSMLKPLLISPAHFQASLLNLHSSSKAKDFGSLVHALVLEPQQVGNEIAVFPGLADARNKDYKAFEAANPARLVIDEPTFRKGLLLAEKIKYRRVRGRFFGDFLAEGQAEVSIYFQEPTTGLMLKVRFDLYHPEISFDLKTTRHATSSAFLRDANDMGYDFQAFMYTFGRSLYEGSASAKPFEFIAAESDEPHSIHVITAGESFMNNGAKKFQEILSVYSSCMAAEYWPDSGGDLVAEIDHWQAFSPKNDWKAALATNAAVPT